VKSYWNASIAIWVCVGVAIGFAVGQHVGSKGSSLGTPLRNAPQAAPAPAPAVAPPGSDQIFKVALGDAPQLGSADAKVTIVEWSDFQCPFCGRVEPTLQQLLDEYKGKIRIAWKNQPLSFHPNAMPAAEAAMAAHEQGKFWEFHDALFKKQGQLSPALYDEVARKLGLDMDRFHASIEAHKSAAHIQSDMTAGRAVGAEGTPTFFINGKKLVGAQPIDAFKQLIDAELAAAVAKK